MLIERIIYLTMSALAAMGPIPHAELLRQGTGIVIAVSDEALKVLISRQAPFSLLYFSKDDYVEATRGLSKKEIEEAVDLRIRKWAPTSLNHASAWLYSAELHCFALTVLAKNQETPSTQYILGSHGYAALDFLGTLNASDQYADVSLVDMFESALEKEVGLIEELTDARSADFVKLDSSESMDFEREIKQRHTFAKGLAATLTRLGNENYRDTLPHTNIYRAVWMAPADTALIGRLKSQFEPYVEYDGGVVSRYNLRRLSELSGKKVSILYANGDEFLENISNTTSAQIRRDLGVRKSRSVDSSTQERREHLSMLRLGLLLLKQALRNRAATESHGEVGGLNSQIQKEMTLLENALVSHRVWLHVSETATKDSRSELLRCEQTLLQDLSILVALARNQGRISLGGLFQKLAFAKATDIKRIESLPPTVQ